jgi:hypothetical protein
MERKVKIAKPNVLYYVKFELVENNNKHPKYYATKAVGSYAPFEALKTNGKISVTLLPAINQNRNAPALRLQAKNSLNLTGIKDVFKNHGQLSGIAFGYPLSTKYYGSNPQRENPFWGYENNAFLFVIPYSGKQPQFKNFEVVVLEKSRVYIELYAKQMLLGAFNNELDDLRRRAVSMNSETRVPELF